MAVATAIFDETRRATLAALCDTFVPALESDSPDPVEREFLARPASALGVAAIIELGLAEAPPEQVAGLAALLDALAAADFAAADLQTRTALVHRYRAADPQAKHALRVLKGLTFLLFYALPGENGSNPNWAALGYPGPVSAAPGPAAAPKTIAVRAPSGAAATLEADAVVVGSGAGGSVIAARLAAAGRRVLVLERGGYRNEQDFNQLELQGLAELYHGGGLTASVDGSISVFAGQTLGGGTVVNYMNCIPTPDDVLAEWAGHGLAGMGDPAAYRRAHVEAVMARLGANTEMTRQNRTHERLREGLDELGIEHRPIWRNAAPGDDPARCGYCGSGCQQGCKRSALKTWLQDASDHGAEAIPGCAAERILVEDGRAVGVAATVTHADLSTTALTIAAPTVVVAGGAIESPALLLRSGIGGPAVGRHLRLHPGYLVFGAYEEPVEGWEGQIQSLLSDHFARLDDGGGFLVEAVGIAPGTTSTVYPWASGEQSKRMLAELRFHAPFVAFMRDRGAGTVTLDSAGQAQIEWALDDEADLRMARRMNVELARIQHAAGAAAIWTGHHDPLTWDRGESFDAFLGAIDEASYAANDVACLSAHQMGSCRMGADPASSVADGRGELHDTRGVWIGDGSAFPSAPGVNPMVSIMALAHRTAGLMLAE